MSLPISPITQNDSPVLLQREKLLKYGAESLSDAELIAIFLRTGLPGLHVLQLAEQLLQQFGSLRALLTATQQEFCQHKGLGQAKYVQLQASTEMTRRYLSQAIRRDNALTSPQQTRQYLTSVLRDQQREVFLILFLDSQNRVIADEILFQGTIDSASVYPREVVKRTMHYNAAALILAHNHPSGIAEPSDADRRITRRLVDALALIDVRILDHFVIGDAQLVSFAERGWM